MPILQVLLSGSPDARRSAAVAAALTGLTADLLGKDLRLTSVAVQYVAPEHWTVGGRALGVQSRASFFLDVRVTEGTNTKDEIARYIGAVFAGMRELLGDLHEASYVHVHEVGAAAWGYGGLTQERRRLAASIA